MGSIIKKIAPYAGAIAGLSGVGLPLAAGIGAGGGLLSGGGVKGALTGAAGGALSAGGGGLLGNALNSNLGLGMQSASQIAGLGGAIGGGAAGALSGGGLKGALTNAAISGLGSYANAGGFKDTLLGNAFGDTAGMSPGEANLLNKAKEAAGVGSLSGGGMNNLSKLAPIASLVSGTQSYLAQDDIEKKLKEQQQRAESAFAPYQNATFNPGDLTKDPGYQFNLAQGQQALDRSLSAKGSYYSGAALKAGQEFSQGLADRTYNDAFMRWQKEQTQGLDAAKAMTGVYDNYGNIGANADVGRSNAISKALSGLTGGGAKTIVGYDVNGKPIYGAA